MPLVVIDRVTHYRIAKYALANNISVDLAIVELVCDGLDREDILTALDCPYEESQIDKPMTARL